MEILLAWDEEVHPAASISLIEAVEQDRERAPHLFVELLSQPPVVRWQLAVNLVRFRSVALAGMLVDASRERRASGGELAELALAILGVLDPSWRTLIDQGKARAWGALADVYRVQGDLARAEGACSRASFHLSNAPDPLENAHFHRLRARLLRSQGKLPEAIDLQEKAVRRLTRFATPAVTAEALVELAGFYEDAGDMQRTLVALGRASAMVDWSD
jgi:tetratricopeptide (TPR) repeat protein